MTRPAAEHPAAGAELLAAAEYYESLVPGLGYEFMVSIAEAVRSIEDRPTSWPPVVGGPRGAEVRSRSARAFPYRVVYVHHRPGATVLTYAHDRRRPGYWSYRTVGPNDG